MKRILLLFILALNYALCNSQTPVMHTIQRGETISSIAKKYGVEESEIYKANPEKKNYYAGITLVIPTSKDIVSTGIEKANTVAKNPKTQPVVPKTSYSSSNKRLVSTRNGKYGVCDEDNKVVIPFEYDYITSIDVVKDKAQIYKVRKNGKEGILDKDGNVIISHNRGYNEIYPYFDFQYRFDYIFGEGTKGFPEGYFEVTCYNPKDKNHKRPYYGICDLSGKEIIQPLFYLISSTIREGTDFYLKAKKKSEAYSAHLLLNEFGESTRTPARQFDEYKNYNPDNYIKDAIRGLYNEYKAIYDVDWKSKYKRITYDKDADVFYVTDGNYTGVCERNGYETIPLSEEYKYVRFSDNYFKVSKDEQFGNKKADSYGACDMAGIEFIPPMFYHLNYDSDDNEMYYSSVNGSGNTITDVFDKFGFYQGSISAEEIAINEMISRSKAEEQRQIEQHEKQIRRQEIMSAVMQTAVQVGMVITENKLQKQTAAKPNVKLGDMSQKELANYTNSELSKIAQLSSIKVSLQEQNEYLNFAQYNKKPDGSMYSIDEWRTMKGAAIMQLKEEGYDIIGETNEMLRQERKERDEERRAEAKKRNEQIIARTYGSQLASASATAAPTTTPTTSNTKVTSPTTIKTATSNTAKTELDSRQQFKSDPVSSDDYRYIKKVTLYSRHTDTAKEAYRDVELCTKGGFKYIKLGNKYYPRTSSNWSRFSNAITYASEQLYYNE